MQRLNEDDGAVAVIVAVTLVVMLGMGALVMDVGNLYWERRQLQAGADAGALAAAHDLAEGGTESVAKSSARSFADQNNTRGAYVDVDGEGFDFDPVAQEVTVTAETGDYEDRAPLESWLARVIGVDSYATVASATAAYGPLGSAATLPITFSYCEWESLVGDVNDPNLPTEAKTLNFFVPGGEDCKGPAGHYAPAGWGWLATNDEGTCTADVSQGEVPGQQGQGVPSFGDGCTESYFESLVGETVLMPIFENVTGQGNNVVYTILGFAAVEIQAYNLHPGNGWSHDAPCTPGGGNQGGGNQGGGNQGGGNQGPSANTCITANFVDFVSYGDHVDWGGGPDLGTSVVSLIR